MGGLLVVLGVVCLAYSAVGYAVRGRPPYDGADTRPLAAFAQARRDTFVRLSRPMATLGAVLVIGGLTVMVVGR